MNTQQEIVGGKLANYHTLFNECESTYAEALNKLRVMQDDLPQIERPYVYKDIPGGEFDIKVILPVGHHTNPLLAAYNSYVGSYASSVRSVLYDYYTSLRGPDYQSCELGELKFSLTIPLRKWAGYATGGINGTDSTDLWIDSCGINRKTIPLYRGLVNALKERARTYRLSQEFIGRLRAAQVYRLPLVAMRALDHTSWRCYETESAVCDHASSHIIDGLRAVAWILGVEYYRDGSMSPLQGDEDKFKSLCAWDNDKLPDEKLAEFMTAIDEKRQVASDLRLKAHEAFDVAWGYKETEAKAIGPIIP